MGLRRRLSALIMARAEQVRLIPFTSMAVMEVLDLPQRTLLVQEAEVRAVHWALALLVQIRHLQRVGRAPAVEATEIVRALPRGRREPAPLQVVLPDLRTARPAVMEHRAARRRPV